MRIEQLDLTDTETIAACYQVEMAAHATDDPQGHELSAGTFRYWLTVGWTGVPREVWFVREAGAPGGVAVTGRAAVAGWLLLELPERENPTRAGLGLLVHPALRRRGIGRALLRHATRRAADAGRVAMVGFAWDGSPGEAFAQQADAKPVHTDVRRVQDLTNLPPLAGLRAEAERAAAGYSLVSWTGPVPDEYLADAAELNSAMADAPRPEGAEHTQWDAERLRESVNGIFARTDVHGYSVAARHDQTGAMAALSQVWADPAVPGWALQGNTVVTRQHRGHRLGLRVKLAMLDLLAEAEPGISRIETWNAERNEYMIAINEALGYKILGPPSTQWQLDC
jgi:GNAT superfamily N-acetyltransferase